MLNSILLAIGALALFTRINCVTYSIGKTMLDNFMENHDPSTRPMDRRNHFGFKPSSMPFTANISITITDIEISKSLINIDFYVIVSWYDPRLSLADDEKSIPDFAIPEDYNVWDAKSSIKGLDDEMRNQSECNKFWSAGSVIKSICRLSKTNGCQNMGSEYPFEKFRCQFAFQSKNRLERIAYHCPNCVKISEGVEEKLRSRNFRMKWSLYQNDSLTFSAAWRILWKNLARSAPLEIDEIKRAAKLSQQVSETFETIQIEVVLEREPESVLLLKLFAVPLSATFLTWLTIFSYSKVVRLVTQIGCLFIASLSLLNAHKLEEALYFVDKWNLVTLAFIVVGLTQSILFTILPEGTIETDYCDQSTTLIGSQRIVEGIDSPQPWSNWYNCLAWIFNLKRRPLLNKLYFNRCYAFVTTLCLACLLTTALFNFLIKYA